MSINLRHYQRDMVVGVSNAYQQGARGIILRSATGSGKTRTASFVVQKYTTTSRQILWLVDQEELLEQAALTFAEYGIEHCLVCADQTKRAIIASEFREFGRSFVKAGAGAVIASVQTLVRRIEGERWHEGWAMKWLNPDQIIADEADLSLAITWRKVIGYWPKARLLGLTATPIRMDRQSFARKDGGLYDVMVKGPEESWLIANGYLCPYDAYKPDVHLVEGVADLGKMRGDDYDPRELEKELDAPKVFGDVVQHYRDYSHGKPAIAFCPTVASAEKFAEAFRREGYRALSLDGMTDGAVRRRAVKQLGNGEMDVLTGVGLLVKGVDIPYATTAIWLRRTKSLRIFLQGTGRVLRPHPDKDRAIILDCVGVIEEHGLPHWVREWTLEPPEKKSRRAAANDDEPDIGAKACPACRRYHEPGEKRNEDGHEVCPHCNHVYPKKERREAVQVDAQLKKITDEEDERLRRMKRIAQGQAKTVDELVAMGIPRFRAMKIVQAREAKEALQTAVMEAMVEQERQHGPGVWREHGVSLQAINRMKPAELKALLARLPQEFRIEAA